MFPSKAFLFSHYKKRLSSLKTHFLCDRRIFLLTTLSIRQIMYRKSIISSILRDATHSI